jgi:acetylglutamate kinase
MTRVIKVGGRPQTDPALIDALASSWKREESKFILVHGGGDEVSALQAGLGSTASFVGGRRVTTAADIDIVRMALSGAANKRLVAGLVDRGIEAIGLSGEDAGAIVAKPLDIAKLGFVGTPCRVNTALLEHLIDGGYLPVISPVSRAVGLAEGSTLNVNGDDAAAAIAVSIGASELLLVADVAGVMAEGAVVASLSIEGAKRLIEDGTASAGMRAKLEAGISAVEKGVARVRIADIRAINDPRRGTSLSAIGELS